MMATEIAGLDVPETAAAAAADALAVDLVSPLLLAHSRRVHLFALLHAERLGIAPDPELLYLAALFHDTGLAVPYSDATQRFEVDGADHGRAFLLDHGFSDAAADTVWTAIALHTTPGIPGRMGPEIAALHFGVLTDVLGVGLNAMDPAVVHAITDLHPRGDFAEGFLHAVVEGHRNRPETANGTVNADILTHFLPDLHLTTTVERILGAPWTS
jgi:hypothetical protein